MTGGGRRVREVRAERRCDGQGYAQLRGNRHPCQAWFCLGGFYKDPDYMHFFKVTDGSEDDPSHRPFQASSLQYLRPGTDGSAPK
jgi:hypothetical protein